MRPLLVGEANPLSADPRYALYPAPPGSTGGRLCRLVLGLSKKDYIGRFDRVNLCAGPWRVREARETVRLLATPPAVRLRGGYPCPTARRAPSPKRAVPHLICAGSTVVLLGRRVAAAFGLPDDPLTRCAMRRRRCGYQSVLCDADQTRTLAEIDFGWLEGVWSIERADAPLPAGRSLRLVDDAVPGRVGFEEDDYAEPFEAVVLPHPSGLNRFWNRPGAFEGARELLREAGAL